MVCVPYIHIAGASILRPKAAKVLYTTRFDKAYLKVLA